MRRLIVALLVLGWAGIGWADDAAMQMQTTDLALMTVPELATVAAKECAAAVERKQAAHDAIAYMSDMANRGEINAGLTASAMAAEALEHANIHRDNLQRIRLVVRDKLGTEPQWAATYAAAESCVNARVQYDEWAQAQPKITPQKRTARKK